MKKDNKNKITLGVFVSTAVALFVLGIYMVGSHQQLFSNTFRLQGIFKNVSGLMVGDNVRFLGISVGIIDKIEIVTDSTVRVDMVINSETKKFIKKDALALISSEGLMGNKAINIVPGSSSEIIEDRDVIITETPVSMDQLMSQLRVTTDNAAKITTDLAVITHNIRRGKGTVGKLFMDTVFADNLGTTIVNLKQGTKGFSQNMEAAKRSFLLKGGYKKMEKEEQEKQKKEQEKK